MLKNSSKLGLILGLSLAFNIFMAYQLTELAREQNISWSNNFTEVAKVVSWISNKPESYQGLPTSIEDIENYTKNLAFVSRQLNTIRLLPKADQIIPFESAEKIKILAGYHNKVLELAKKELEDSGQISPANLERLKVINKAWFEFLKMLEEEKNQVDPFSPVFKEETWRDIWLQAVSSLETVELIPLDK